MFVEEKTQGEVAPAKVGTLKLSEAIREGAKKGPQCRGIYKNALGATCAWGAAGEALGISPLALHGSSAFESAEEAFRAAHGVSIAMANDDGFMTRERIADALEALGY